LGLELAGPRENTETITQQINYAFAIAASYESEGTNRNVPVNWGTVAQRDAVSGGSGSAYSTATAALPASLNVSPALVTMLPRCTVWVAGRLHFQCGDDAGGTVRN